MKIGIRKPNLKKSIKARTTEKVKRSVKRSINPLYGKKGIGFIKNPKKAIYNKVYNKTSISAKDFLNKSNNIIVKVCILMPIMLVYYSYKYLFLGIIWIVRKIARVFNKNNKEKR